MLDMLPVLPALQLGVLDSQLGKLLIVLLGVAVVLLIGRFVMRVAWRLVVAAAVVVAILLVLTTFGII